MTTPSVTPGLLSIHVQSVATVEPPLATIDVLVSEAVYDPTSATPAVPVTKALYVKRPAVTYSPIDQYVTISNKIPRQVLKLVGYRVELKDITVPGGRFTGDIDCVHVELPCLSDMQMVDNHVSTTMIPLPLDEGRVTNVTGLSIPIYMSQDLQAVFKIRIYEDDPNVGGQAVLSTNVVKVSLFFQFDFTVGGLKPSARSK